MNSYRGEIWLRIIKHFRFLNQLYFKVKERGDRVLIIFKFTVQKRDHVTTKIIIITTPGNAHHSFDSLGSYIKVGKKSLGYTLYLFLASVLISVSLIFLKVAIIMKIVR